jgi:hypothetical protein
MNCLMCSQKLKGIYTIKFCSKSCAAKFNNKKRTHSLKSKSLISKSLKLFYKQNPDVRKYKPTKIKKYTKIKICNFCKKEFLATRNNNKSETWPRLCSNKCLLGTKRKNARSNKNVIYKNIHFDSNWEKQLAIFLDEKNIKWDRPTEPILWFDSMLKQRKYFPDFYLPKFNIYLDPKNPICCYQQQEKLKVVSKLINLIYGDLNFIKDKVAGLEGFEPSTL